MADAHHSSLLSSATWMLVISLLLFFVPAVNGLIGGLVGGYKAGTIGRGVVASLLPAMALGIILWVLLSLFEVPVILGALGGLLFGAYVVVSSLSMVIGAFLGGLIAPEDDSQPPVSL